MFHTNFQTLVLDERTSVSFGGGDGLCLVFADQVVGARDLDNVCAVGLDVVLTTRSSSNSLWAMQDTTTLFDHGNVHNVPRGPRTNKELFQRVIGLDCLAILDALI